MILITDFVVRKVDSLKQVKSKLLTFNKNVISMIFQTNQDCRFNEHELLTVYHHIHINSDVS